MEKVYILFEGDASGLGDLEGVYESLELAIESAKELHEVTQFFYEGRILNNNELIEELSKEEHCGSINLIGERGQHCLIFQSEVTKELNMKNMKRLQ